MLLPAGFEQRLERVELKAKGKAAVRGATYLVEFVFDGGTVMKWSFETGRK